MRRSLIPRGPRAVTASAFVTVVALVLVSGVLAGCTRDSGLRDPLAPSGPPERVMRTLRLAGVENAAVGERRGTAIVRIEVPGISSAGDVEIAWQLGATALAEAYPRARTYAVQVFGPGTVPLVELSLQGRDAREAIEDDDAVALRASAVVKYLLSAADFADSLLEGTPADGTVLPRDALAMESDVSGAYLDAKNRAAALSGDADGITALATAAAARTRLAVPGRSAPGPDEDTGLVLAGRLSGLLGTSAPEAGQGSDTTLLREFAASVRADADPQTVLRLRTWFAVVEAVTAEKPFGSVIAPVRASARAVSTAKMPDRKSLYREGRFADAVLVAAKSPNAPADLKVVTRFLRGERYDMIASAALTATSPTTSPPTQSVDASASAVPREALARIARDASVGGPPAISWETTAGTRAQVAPPVWLAYLRRDGRMFWLAGENGPVALTDASVTGWAWSAPRAAVVDAGDVGIVLSTIDLR